MPTSHAHGLQGSSSEQSMQSPYLLKFFHGVNTKCHGIFACCWQVKETYWLGSRSTHTVDRGANTCSSCAPDMSVNTDCKLIAFCPTLGCTLLFFSCGMLMSSVLAAHWAAYKRVQRQSRSQNQNREDL